MIKERLEFGNAEHIKKLKDIAAQEEFDALPACPECQGETECTRCHNECPHCEGTGKENKAWWIWKQKHPHFWPEYK